MLTSSGEVPVPTAGGCLFSPCRKYRYELWRTWEGIGPKDSYLMVIGLNPSTADEKRNDPTVTRCIKFAQRWGFAGLCMTNAFALRATDPKVMRAHPAPIGPDNDERLHSLACQASMVLAAWGTHGNFKKRDIQVLKMMSNSNINTWCLKETKGGMPWHPLYARADTVPMLYLKGGWS